MLSKEDDVRQYVIKRPLPAKVVILDGRSRDRVTQFLEWFIAGGQGEKAAIQGAQDSAPRHPRYAAEEAPQAGAEASPRREKQTGECEYL